jgi:hypothetical protein
MTSISPIRHGRAIRRGALRGACGWLVLAGGAQIAHAQVVQSIDNSDLGSIVSAPNGDTLFRIEPSTGIVTKVSGSGVRLSTGTTRSLVTIYCDSRTCDRDLLKVEVGAVGTPTNRAKALSNFTVADGTATLGPVTGTNPITFSTTTAIRSRNTLTFYIGMDFPIAGNNGGLPTGLSTSCSLSCSWFMSSSPSRCHGHDRRKIEARRSYPKRIWQM